MILCVTLNPCLDKTLTVPNWRAGELVRGTAVREVVGGKGNNVARSLSKLGREARPVTFLGGAVGSACERLLRLDDRLEPIVVPTATPTRVILTVRTEGSSEQTAFFDPDPAIQPAEADALQGAVEAALDTGSVQLLTLSGSSPDGSTDSLYSDLISLARASRVPVFLDTYGSALESIWGFWPDALQLNRREAAGHLGKPPGTLGEGDVLDLLDDWFRHGVKAGLVTDGPGPVVACLRGTYLRATPPEIEVVNPIGSGDSMLAGLADGWLTGLEPEALLRRAVACGVANALTWDAGAIDPEAVAKREAEVTIEVIDHAPPAPAAAGLMRTSIARRK